MKTWILTLLIFIALSPLANATIFLFSPENNSYTNLNNNSLQFVYNHTGTLTGIVNCTLYLDGNPVNYSTGVPANTSFNIYIHSTQ